METFEFRISVVELGETLFSFLKSERCRSSITGGGRGQQSQAAGAVASRPKRRL